MIIANLASYPPRRSNLPRVVATLAPQVDRINLVLNEYDGPLEELSSYANVKQIMPDEDTKDAGKFYPDTSDADYVFFVDDDLIYPADFIAKSIERFEALGKGHFLGGYHASIYTKPAPSLSPKRLLKWLTYSREKIADHRRPFRFYETLEQPVVVDQVATNAALMRGADVPPYAYMASSQKFVDVRLAKWCFENGIRSVALPKQAHWLGEVRFEETIFHGFTRKNLPHVADEIWSYAFKAEGLGAPVEPRS
ncbi:glycosyltransferase family 2 protein [Alphaproteobacteria bacterium KMM 3653]|uniref:Glycosyltransferase family 2 protein n=1 Tax=Harenicola maris TaxID=2841044 RepID=A0AAP2CQL8_9RHOB|nr:glycosyltransferase family 2 protein [Harenicola maris]